MQGILYLLGTAEIAASAANAGGMLSKLKPIINAFLHLPGTFIMEERRSVKHQWRLNTGLSRSPNLAANLSTDERMADNFIFRLEPDCPDRPTKRSCRHCTVSFRRGPRFILGGIAISSVTSINSPTNFRSSADTAHGGSLICPPFR